MTTTVRITAQAKDRLERLREEWGRRTGKRPTLQALIDELARDGERDPGHIIDAAWKPPGAAVLDAYRHLVGDIEAGVADIDDVVYGED